MSYKHINVPSEGTKITFENWSLVVPDNPIIPFIEGDGIGVDFGTGFGFAALCAANFAFWDAINPASESISDAPKRSSNKLNCSCTYSSETIKLSEIYVCPSIKFK